MADAYRKIRNTLRFLLGNLNDFDPHKHLKKYEELTEIDMWILARTQKLIREVTAAYENFEFHKVYHLVYNFCTVELSSFYLDILKDRLYTFSVDSSERRSAQTVFHYLVRTLSTLIAPVLVFTSEEVWQLYRSQNEPESVHLLDFPPVNPQWENEALLEKWSRLIGIRAEAAKLLENMRASKEIGNALECRIDISTENEEQFEFLRSFKEELAAVFIVSELNVRKVEKLEAEQAKNSVVFDGMSIAASKTGTEKCHRCWRYHISVGSDEQYPDICSRCAEVVSKLDLVKPA